MRTARHRGANAFEHLQHLGIVGAVDDLERGKLCVLDHRCVKLLIDEVRLGIEAGARTAMPLDDAFLKTPACIFRHFAAGDVGKQQDDAEHAIR